MGVCLNALFEDFLIQCQFLQRLHSLLACFPLHKNQMAFPGQKNPLPAPGRLLRKGNHRILHIKRMQKIIPAQTHIAGGLFRQFFEPFLPGKAEHTFDRFLPVFPVIPQSALDNLPLSVFQFSGKLLHICPCAGRTKAADQDAAHERRQIFCRIHEGFPIKPGNPLREIQAFFQQAHVSGRNNQHFRIQHAQRYLF